jgi:hypothetical protein
VKPFAVAVALAVVAAPCLAASTGDSFNVNITVNAVGAPPPPGVEPSPAASDLCVSQALGGATGAVVSVVCRSGQFVSIEPRFGQAFQGVHGGAFRYYFANGIPESLRYLGGAHPWVGAGTVTSIRIHYPEGLDDAVEMRVGF